MRAIFIALLLTLLSLSAQATETLVCDICGKTLSGKYYTREDQIVGVTLNVCADCKNLKDHCTICGRPVLAGGTTLPDGRVFCPRDARAVVSSDDEALRICDDVRKDIDRLFARYMQFPETNVIISMVNPLYLDNLFKSPDEEQPCVGFYGATSANHVDGRVVHSVAILNHLRPEQLRHTCAHEFTHAWINQNVNKDRRKALDKDTEEGFCELVACKYMESLHETCDMEITKKNSYTKGKILVLLEADARYGFGTLEEWVKSGDDPSLEAGKLERIRAVDGAYVSSADKPLAMPAYVAPAASAATPVLGCLTLQSISGTPGHRFAIVNNETFEPFEKGRVKVGGTNLMIQCLEINADSAVVQEQDSFRKTVLKLKGVAP